MSPAPAPSVTHTVRQTLTRRLADHQATGATIARQISSLQQQQADLEATCRHLAAELAAFDAAGEHEQARIRQLLDASYASLLAGWGYGSARRTLAAQSGALLTADPELSALLSDYRRFMADPAAALQQLPLAYHAGILTQHAALEHRLTPYLAVESALADLVPPERINLHIVVNYNPSESRLQWLVPLPMSHDRVPADSQDVVTLLTEVVAAAFTQLRQHRDWDLDAVTPSAALGYLVLSALAEYGGTGSIHEAFAPLLQAKLSTTPVLASYPIDIVITELSADSWEALTPIPNTFSLPTLAAVPARTPDPQESAPVTPLATGALAPPGAPNAPAEAVTGDRSVASPTAVTAPSPATLTTPDTIPLAPPPGAWYTEADIVTWERPVKGAGAGQNAPARQVRRLRTLLTRLVAQGIIGGRSISCDRLWNSLPTPHREELREDLARLLIAAILQETGPHPAGGVGVTLNPAMLVQIQSLVAGNSVTSPDTFWQRLLPLSPERDTPVAPASRLPARRK